MIRLGIGIEKTRRSGGLASIVTDLDALAYVTAANITSSTEQVALNDFVIALKACNMWDRLYAFYPLLGSTLTQTTYNLKDPATYQITWTGSPTIVSKGLQFDGTTQHGDPNFSPIAVPGFSMANFMFGCYDATGFNSRTEIPMGITEGEFGETRARAVWFADNSNILDIWASNNSSSRVVFSGANGQAVGHWAFERRSTTSVKVYQFTTSSGDNYEKGQSTTAAPIATPTNKFLLAATSAGLAGVNSVALRSNKLYKYFYLAQATLSAAQFLQFRTALYNFNVATGK